MNVHVVLDTTALVAYARLDSLAVGELMKEVGDNGGTIGVGAPAWADAYATVDPGGRKHLLAMLADDNYILILPMLADDLPDVGEIAARHPLPLAHAIVQTRRYGAPLATLDPRSVADDMNSYDVFDLN